MSAPPIGANGGADGRSTCGASVERPGLLEPAVLHQQVHPAVAIHVAHAQPVPERDRGHLARRSHGTASLERPIGLERGIAEEAVPRADELGPRVPHDVR